MRVCYAFYSNLYLVILGFDDKFSQSSRFCWGSNFSLSLNLEPQSYLVPDFKKQNWSVPWYFRLCPVFESPFLSGVVWRIHWGLFVYGSGLEIISRSRWGTTKEMTMSWDSWLKSIQLSFCPPVREWRAIFTFPTPIFLWHLNH